MYDVFNTLRLMDDGMEVRASAFSSLPHGIKTPTLSLSLAVADPLVIDRLQGSACMKQIARVDSIHEEAQR